MLGTAVITIGISPELHIGGLTLAWHGLTIAVGLLVGGLIAARCAAKHELDSEPISTFVVLAALGGIVGGRLFYVLEHGGPLLDTRGFTFDGGLILAAALIAVYVWRTHLSARYLDALAIGLPVGVAVGRVGDIINGEHYGPPSSFFLAVRNSHPDALTPDPTIAYHNGGVYEALLALLIFALVWPFRDRLRQPTDLMWLVLALFSVGRLLEFFLRSDSPELALGLSNAQWTSVVLLALTGVGYVLVRRRRSRG